MLELCVINIVRVIRVLDAGLSRHTCIHGSVNLKITYGSVINALC